MKQYCASDVRRYVSCAWLEKMVKPIWIVNGKKCHTPVAAIVPAAIYHKLQEMYGVELELLSVPSQEKS